MKRCTGSFNEFTVSEQIEKSLKIIKYSQQHDITSDNPKRKRVFVSARRPKPQSHKAIDIENEFHNVSICDLFIRMLFTFTTDLNDTRFTFFTSDDDGNESCITDRVKMSLLNLV